MRQKKYGWFIVLALLAGSCGVQVWLILGAYGLFIAVRALYSLRVARLRVSRNLKKEFVFGALFAFISFSFFYLLTNIVIPCLHDNCSASFVEKMFVSSPETLSSFLEPSRRAYIRQLFLPLGYLSLLSPLYLIFASHDFLMNLILGDSNHRQIYYQYTATITPFLFIAAIYGVRLLRYFASRLPLSFFTVLLALTTIYTAYLYGPLPFAKNANTTMFAKCPNASLISDYLKTIPEDATVSTNNQLGSHISKRKTIYILPEGTKEAEYVLFLLSNETTTPARQVSSELSDMMKNSPEHILIFDKGNFLVFKKNRLSSLLY